MRMGKFAKDGEIEDNVLDYAGQITKHYIEAIELEGIIIFAIISFISIYGITLFFIWLSGV